MMTEGLPGGCNPADVLNKLATARGIKAPTFELIGQEGPPHNMTFTWSCSFFQGQYQAVGSGRSKKDAKNAAAKALIDQIDLSSLPTRNRYGRGGFAYRFERGEKRKLSEGGEDPNGGTEDQENSGGEEGENGNGETVGQNGKAKNKKKKKNNKLRGFGDMGGFGPMGMGPMPLPGLMGMGPPMGRSLPPMGFNIGLGAMGPPMMGAGFMGQQRPRFQHLHLTIEDRYVIERHRQVYPKKEELNLVLTLSDKTERALKRASDKLCTKEVTVAENGEEKKICKKVEEERELLGVARVGELAKGLLLTGDRSVNLVVMCKKKPTNSMLEAVSSAVKEELMQERVVSAKKEGEINEEKEEEDKAKDEKPQYEIHCFPEEGGFCVVTVQKDESELPYAVNVTLTSTCLRKKEAPAVTKEGEEEKKEEAEVKPAKEDDEEDSPDMLPREKCLQALAELRHTKWFTNMAAPLPSCVETIRIFRDMAQRLPAWGELGDWGIELLVERALSSCDITLPPAKSIMRCLEVVASGLLMQDGRGIKDPCEREELDVFSNLTVQQRENVTYSAQEMIRKIHYRKIHEVLGMERLVRHQQRRGNREKQAKADATEAEKAVEAEATPKTN